MNPETTNITPAMADDLLKLDNQLCFAFYVCSKEIIKKYRPLLEPLGLTYTGYIAMLALWEQDGVTVKQLGGRLYLDSGTLTPLLKKLEAQGYIHRRRDPVDERNVIICLTDEGRSLRLQAMDVPLQLMCTTGADELGAEGADLAGTLRKLMGLLTRE